MVQGRLTEADPPTIRLGATPSGLTSVHHHSNQYYNINNNNRHRLCHRDNNYLKVVGEPVTFRISILHSEQNISSRNESSLRHGFDAYWQMTFVFLSHAP